MSQPSYKRWQMQRIQQALKTRRVLILAGPRQCGKTTLAKELASSNTIYRTLDDVTLLEAAQADPRGFVQHGNELMIIDEIQKAPILLQAIKQDVDTNPAYGRFLLTGSANIQSLPGVTESLAGRVRKIRLRPLAQGEIFHQPPSFIKRIFSKSLNSFKIEMANPSHNKRTYLEEAFYGGYPEARTLDKKEMRRWHIDYLEALFERDLKDIVHIRRHDSMKELLHAFSSWSSKFMDVAAIGSGLSLSRQTIESYRNALEALYLIERVKPWSKTDYDRVGKQDKTFMTDTGLMSSVLQWNIDKIELDGEKNGKLLETFVFNQLSALLEAQEDAYQMYHYRDREQREIDFLIEHEDGSIVGIEVKASSTVSRESFKHLKWFQEKMVHDFSFTGIVLYTGEQAVSFGENMWAVPICAMWST
ncbi:MAG: ATP-binding protein [Bdellovibrionota bacterium]